MSYGNDRYRGIHLPFDVQVEENLSRDSVHLYYHNGHLEMDSREFQHHYEYYRRGDQMQMERICDHVRRLDKPYLAPQSRNSFDQMYMQDPLGPMSMNSPKPPKVVKPTINKVLLLL